VTTVESLPATEDRSKFRVIHLTFALKMLDDQLAGNPNGTATDKITLPHLCLKSGVAGLKQQDVWESFKYAWDIADSDDSVLANSMIK
jgi:hypothetical protein